MFPIRPKVEANKDWMAGLMGTDPAADVLVNWVKSCCNEARLVGVMAAEPGVTVVADEDPDGDIKLGALL